MSVQSISQLKAALVKRGLPAEAVEFLAAVIPATDLSYKPQKVMRAQRGGGFIGLAIPYVDRDAVAKRLHESGLAWSYIPQLIERTDLYACVLGTIRIELEGGRIVEFSDYGEAENKRSFDNRELVKEANTDAIKRAGRLLMIGAELSKAKKFWKPCLVENPKDTKLKFQAWAEEEDEPDADDAEQDAPAQTKAQLLQQIEQLIAKHKIKREDLVSYAKKTFKCNTLDELSETEAKALVDEIFQRYETKREVQIAR